MRRTHLGLLATALVLTLGACGDDDGSSGGGDDEGGVAGAIAGLPAPEGEGLTVTYADLDAVNEANGLEANPEVDDATPDWIATTTGLADAAAMVVPPPVVRAATPDEFVESAGFWWGGADGFAAVSSPPDELGVFEGDLDAGDATLETASDDDAVAVASSSELLDAWGGDDAPRLDENASVAAVADGLDDADVISAVLVTLPDPAPVPAVGIGWIGADDDSDEGALAAVVYDLGSEDAADEAAPDIEAGFAEEPASGLVELVDVEVSGQVVVATVRLTRDQVSTPYEMLVRGDLPLPQ